MDTPAVTAVICDVVFLPEVEKGENVRNAGLIIIHVDVTKAGLFRGKFGTAIAVNPDRLGCRANVLDVGRVTKKVNGGLTVQ